MAGEASGFKPPHLFGTQQCSTIDTNSHLQASSIVWSQGGLEGLVVPGLGCSMGTARSVCPVEQLELVLVPWGLGAGHLGS